MVNSRQGRFSATPRPFAGKRLQAQGRAFSRSYGSILPSSLTRVLSFALVYSTCPPVSVCGTGKGTSTFRGFSRPHGLNHLSALRGIAITSQPRRPDFPGRVNGLPAWHRDVHHPAGLPFGVPPSLHAPGTGILTCCPSPTAHALSLGPTNPTRNDLPSETSGFRRMRFARISRYSYRHSHFRALHCSSRYSFIAHGTLPYQGSKLPSAASVTCLAPLHFRRRSTRPVSYYALFKGWLLLSQPPGCLSTPTSFPT